MGKRHLRTVFGRFATGVTVVTFERDSEVYGMTVNSFSSVSLEPPLVLFCPSIHCRFAHQAELGSLFTISILRRDQHDVCLHFAGRPCLDRSPWEPEDQLPPVVRESLAYLRCELVALHPHGDHLVAVGRVLEAQADEVGDPLLFYAGGYPVLESATPLVENG